MFKIIVNGREINYHKYGSMPYQLYTRDKNDPYRPDPNGGKVTMIPYRALLEDGFGMSPDDIIWNGED